MEPNAPVGPAGKVEQDQLSDISSLPAMSVDTHTGIGGTANATADVGELTQAKKPTSTGEISLEWQIQKWLQLLPPKNSPP